MNKIFLFSLLSVFNVIYCANTSLPKCAFTDTECLKLAFTHVLKTYYKGLDEIYLPVIDPLYIGKIEVINTNKNNAIPISIIFENTTLSGLKNFETTAIKIRKNDNKFIINMKFKAPYTKLVSNYTAKGNVLLLQINGHGKSISTLDDIIISTDITGKFIKKNNKDYIYMDTIANSFQFKNASLFFDNLFNGDKELSDTTNKFLNDNAITLTNDMKTVFAAELSKALKKIINNIFDNIPATDLYLEI